ncbi:MAG: response regulator [Desulfobacterales bacterium]|nr:response regulator [Desulfobacterales bacterium]
MSKKRKILLIDDEESIRATLKNYFVVKEYEVTVVGDGQDAIKLLSLGNETFDIVMTDLKMKGVSGIAVTHWTKKHFPGVPVVVITGNLDQYESLAIEAKPDLLLEKPLDFNSLDDTIQALLAQKESKRDDRERLEA